MISSRPVLLILGLLILQALQASATLPEDAQTIALDESVEGFAPGAYYKLELTETGTLAVIMDSVPVEMITRINIISEDGTWLASEDSPAAGQLMTVNAPIEAPGWYWIEILDLEGKTLETPYTFRAALERVPG